MEFIIEVDACTACMSGKGTVFSALVQPARQMHAQLTKLVPTTSRQATAIRLAYRTATLFRHTVYCRGGARTMISTNVIECIKARFQSRDINFSSFFLATFSHL
jgi:hypothetical protein